VGEHPRPAEPLPIAASTEHLTDAFRRAGLLGDGRVSDVVESSRDTILSWIIRLRLSYQGASDAPKSVILKTGLPERAGGTWNVDIYENVLRPIRQEF
jgi:hypothetical protein